MWLSPIHSNQPTISVMYFHNEVKDFVTSVTENVAKIIFYCKKQLHPLTLSNESSA